MIVFMYFKVICQIQFDSTKQNQATSFNNFKTKYSKNYNNPSQELYRNLMLYKNADFIAYHNSDQSQTYKLKLNQFSDLSQLEFKFLYSTLRKPSENIIKYLALTKQKQNLLSQLPSAESKGVAKLGFRSAFPSDSNSQINSLQKNLTALEQAIKTQNEKYLKQKNEKLKTIQKTITNFGATIPTLQTNDFDITVDKINVDSKKLSPKLSLSSRSVQFLSSTPITKTINTNNLQTENNNNNFMAISIVNPINIQNMQPSTFNIYNKISNYSPNFGVTISSLTTNVVTDIPNNQLSVNTINNIPNNQYSVNSINNQNIPNINMNNSSILKNNININNNIIINNNNNNINTNINKISITTNIIESTNINNINKNNMKILSSVNANNNNITETTNNSYIININQTNLRNLTNNLNNSNITNSTNITNFTNLDNITHQLNQTNSVNSITTKNSVNSTNSSNSVNSTNSSNSSNPQSSLNKTNSTNTVNSSSSTNITNIANSTNITNNSTNLTNIKKIDWSNKTGPVIAQGNCGACYAIAAVNNLQAVNTIFLFKIFLRLSVQQLIDCGNTLMTFGCDGGFLQGAFMYLKTTGVANDYNYPYVSDESGKANSCKRLTTGFRIVDYVSIPAGDCFKIKQVLNKKPITIGIASAGLQFYDSGVFNSCQHQADHAVLLVGFDPSKGWKIKNCWGKAWGEAGYAWIADGNNCRICDYAIYPIGLKQPLN